MDPHNNKDIGILDLELYHLKHTNNSTVTDEEAIETFITDLQKQLFQFIIRERKRILLFKGIDPFVKYINKQDKTVLHSIKNNAVKEQQDASLRINFGNGKLTLEIEKEKQYTYKKNLFISLLESLDNLETFRNELRYLDESDLLSNQHCSIFNNKIWNTNDLKYKTETISEEINLRVFFMLKEFMKPYMKDETIKNEGFSQILSFNKENEKTQNYDFTLPAFSDEIKQKTLIKSFHCLKITEMTTKLTCRDNVSNNLFLHSLRTQSSSLPYLYPDVVPQENHFVCFVDINDIIFDNSIKHIYSQVGYHDFSVTESSVPVVRYDCFYNLRLWNKFNSFESIESIFKYYFSGLDLHRSVVNEFLVAKLENFITEMDSWILLKILNNKLKPNTMIKIKLNDGFKFLLSKILCNLDDKEFYNFVNEKSSNNITAILVDTSHLAYGNPRLKIIKVKERLAMLLKKDVYYLFNLVHQILSEIGPSKDQIPLTKVNSNSKLSDKFDKMNNSSPNKQSNNLDTTTFQREQRKSNVSKISPPKKNIFNLDIMSQGDLFNIIKQNEIKRNLQKPSQEHIDRIFKSKLKEILKIFKNYDIGNGVGVDVILSHEGLYGIINDSSRSIANLDLDEFEELTANLVDSNELLKFEIDKDFFYRLK